MKCTARLLVLLLSISFSVIYLGIFHFPTNEEFYSNASFSTHLSQHESHNQSRAQENYMKKRKRVLNEICNIYKNPYRIESNSLHYHGNFAQISSFQYFWFKDKYNMICSIQKAGSNSIHNFLRRVLQVSLNSDNPNAENLLEVNSKNGTTFQMDFPVNTDCWPKCAENCTKVIVVRHPLDRVLSAYLYIFENPKGKFYNKKYNWEMFVQNLINYPAEDEKWRKIQDSVGNHWEPYWRVCQVCDNSLRPDHILKLESIHEDLSHYLNEIGLGEFATKFPWSNANSKSTRINEFYSRLSKRTVQELYHIYKADHELFDYDPQPFIDLAH